MPSDLVVRRDRVDGPLARITTTLRLRNERMTAVLAALLPPVVVCAAFIAIAIAVKRHADAEEKDEG